jgi:hypothetical protein
MKKTDELVSYSGKNLSALFRHNNTLNLFKVKIFAPLLKVE